MVLAAFNFVNGGTSIGLMAVVAMVTQKAFIFPSLGATAMILYYLPLSATASPRNALMGHGIGALIGWCTLMLFGLQDSAPAFVTGVDIALNRLAGIPYPMWSKPEDQPESLTLPAHL